MRGKMFPAVLFSAAACNLTVAASTEAPRSDNNNLRPIAGMNPAGLTCEGTGTLRASRGFDTGGASQAIVAADLNNDGYPDLVVAKAFSSSISVLVSNGDGSFQPYQSFDSTTVGSPESSAIAVGDLNTDGIPDVAYASPFSRTVTVFIGNGDATFQTTQSFPSGGDSSSVAIGDFNVDGTPDLVTTNTSDATVSVLLGDGKGSFLLSQSFAAGSGCNSVATGDFNGDALLDVAVTNPGPGTVSILLGNGDGSLQPRQVFAAGTGPWSVSVGDLDADGLQDLVVANFPNSGSVDGAVNVLLGVGDGSFHPTQEFATGLNPRHVTIGDLNADGIADLAIANSLSNSVSVLLGDGDGAFPFHEDFTTGLSPTSVTIGDFNSDGVPDLATADRASRTSSILSGNGDGTFQTRLDYLSGEHLPYSVAIGDLNNDGTPDLAIANFNSSSSSDGTVSVLSGNGDGTFQEFHSYLAGPLPTSVTIGDLNADGFPDLVVANERSNVSDSIVSLLLADGEGSFQPRQIVPTSSPYASSVDVHDMNGDGALDLVVAGSGFGSVMLGNGDGTFLSPLAFETGGQSESMAIDDLNGDGVPDLAIANRVPEPLGIISVLLGQGDGTFLPRLELATRHHARGVAIGDFDSDGALDLAAACFSANNNAIAVFLGNGDGSFQSRHDIETDSAHVSLAAGDLNGDTIPDLAVTNPSTDSIGVLLGNGDGTFEPSLDYATRRLPWSLAMGDLNGDGALDLATAYLEVPIVSILLANVTCTSCPADLTGDTQLNFFDIAAFIDLYNATDPAADFDQSGTLNFFDIVSYLDAYNAGCP